MEFNLTTPALLFSAIWLFFLAFTNRFLALANLVRELNQKFKTAPGDESLARQIRSLIFRIELIRGTQLAAIISFLFCLASMILVMLRLITEGEIVFVASLAALFISLLLSFAEISVSVKALKVELADFDRQTPDERRQNA